jgi:signal transduction histidine kinase/DNA-binding response OmpR family regulator/CHASE3 domain sensor protein
MTMNLLNRITIKSRLWGASALMLLLFLAFGLFSLYEMRALDRLTWTLYDHPFQVSNAAVRAGMEMANMQSSIREALIVRSDAEIAECIQEVREAERLAFDNLEVVRNKILWAEGKQLERDTRELADSRVKIARETMQLIHQGNKTAAITLTLGKGDELAKRLEQKLLELRNYAGNKAKGFMDNAGEQQQQIYQSTIIFLVFAALLAFLLGFFLVRSILPDLAALRGTMAAITRTGRLEKSTVAGAAEIADIAQHFNALVERLQSQFWLKDGLAALNSELAGDLPADDLSARGLNFISRYVVACAGAFYAYNQPGCRWELKAPYALGEGTCLAPQFKAGEGIVGQVAAERKPIFLNGITRDQAVALSGTVNKPPQSLYAFPLLYQGELSGVIEVASFTDLDAGQREFLDAAAHILAVSLYAAFQKDRIRGLLKAAQEANEELAVMNEELQAQSEELQAQTEELQAQTEELERQRLRVEESDRLKSEFLSNMSHELRTPLNSVLALTQLMMARGTGKDAVQEAEYLQVIERNGRHLLHLINDILDIARIESGRGQLTLTEIDPGDTCARALETVRPLAAERGLELKAGHGDLPRISTDEDKLQQILINLLSNAVKFTDRGEIELTVEEVGDRVRFVVRDTGAGITPEVLPYIFDKFRQADGSSTRRFEGTGLGLAICRSLAKILDGEITVESLVGRGSTFTLTLPKTGPEPQEAADATPVTRSSPGTTPTQPPPSAARREPPLILVVEDNPVAALQIRTVLEEQGYAVQAVSSGAEALAALPQVRPDLIVLDLMMPEVDGFQVLEQLRAMPAIATIPVLVLTARELTPEDRTRLAHHHIRQFVQKGSLNREELAACVRRLLGNPAAPITPPPAPAPRPQVTRRPGGPILVVENNRDNLLVITAVLDETGYQYVTATDGQKAVALAREEPPALILMDMQLPGVSGLEVAKQIKSDPLLAGTPIAALTAMAMRGDREEILAAGLDDYLAKPFEPQELMELVRRWLG